MDDETKLLKQRFNEGKKQAKKRGKDWDLHFEEYCEIALEPCYYCGDEITSEYGLGLDRVDNSDGYYLENVISCCGDCNALRGDRLTVDETKVAVEAIQNYRADIIVREQEKKLGW